MRLTEAIWPRVEPPKEELAAVQARILEKLRLQAQTEGKEA